MPLRRTPFFAPFPLLYALLCVVGTAQTLPATPAAAFSKARSLYYTPVDGGLEGFHCEVSFAWREFMQKATNQPISEDDARLNYLRTIQLSVDDALRGTGELHWTASAPAPEGSEESVGKIRSGMQQMWAGFFQSWNGYLTGDFVTLDAKAIVEQTPGGFHVAVHENDGVAEESYDSKLLLQSLHVSNPNLDSTVAPKFMASPQGLMVTAIRSTYRQPPTAEPTDVLMKLNYAPVGGFQIPSELQVAVGPASFDFHLANCTVKTRFTAK